VARTRHRRTCHVGRRERLNPSGSARCVDGGPSALAVCESRIMAKRDHDANDEEPRGDDQQEGRVVPRVEWLP
jgi:hypothetical protein